MNIYILIEIKKRELNSKLLLALEAASRGYDVYLGDLMPYVRRGILKPGIFHHKSLTPKKDRIFEMKNLKKKGFYITSQDEEAGYMDEGFIGDNIDYTLSRYGKRTFKLANKVFTWGKYDLNKLAKRYENYKDKIINTGNPKIDYWKHEFKSFFKKKSKKIDILISSNFETICGQRNLANEIDSLRRLGYFERGLEKNSVIERAKDEYLIFSEFYKLIVKLSNKFPKKRIVFRPHPIEKKEDWEKILYELKNVKVNNEGPISDWIANSKIVIHNGCTGGLESALRGIKTLAFIPKKMNIGGKFPNDVSLKCFKIDDVIKNILDKNKTNKKILENKKLKNKIRYKFQNFYKNFAYKKIVDEWEKFSNISINFKNDIFRLKSYGNALKLKLKIIGYKNESTKFSDFSKKEISYIFNNLIKVEKKFKNIKIDFISGKLIRIYK